MMVHYALHMSSSVISRGLRVSVESRDWPSEMCIPEYELLHRLLVHEVPTQN